MNFDFVSQEATDLHRVRLVAIALRENHNRSEPLRKRLMKNARINGDTKFHKTMSLCRPPSWYAIVSCEECPQESLISSRTPMSTRFACTACKQPASLAWVEETSRLKVESMYEKYFDKQVSKAKKAEDPWTTIAKGKHAASVKRTDCKVGATCEWCRERKEK